MNAGGLEHRRLTGKQPVFPAGIAQQDAPGEPKFAAAGVRPHLAARRSNGDLQAPTAAEERHAGREHGPGELDLAHHRCTAVVDVERGPGHGDAVIVFETDAGR